MLEMRGWKKSLSKLATAVALAVALGMGATLPAAAAGDPIVGGTVTDPVRVAATKSLVMPKNTPTPTAQFTFTFEKKSLSGASGSSDLALMPPILDQAVNVGLSDAGATAGGTKTVNKETPDVLAGLNWTREGVYVYTVTETANTYTPHAGTDYVDVMTYSPASYDISVYVAKDAATGKYYAQAVAAVIVVKDGDEGSVGDKVDPTPGGDPSVEGDYSAMVFTNTYTKNNGGTRPDPDGATFALAKTVPGPYGDTTKFFEFAVTVGNPVTITDATRVYKAYVMNAAGVVLPGPDNGNTTGVKPDGSIDFTADVAKTVYLKSGQRLVFIDTYVGAPVAVHETGTPGYSPSHTLTFGDTPGGTVSAGKGLPLGFGTPTPVHTGNRENTATFTNTYETITPTGISVDNLPYVVLIALGSVTLVGLGLARTRRRTKVTAR
ncbi:MAG: hypothetical protein LBV00_12105 [Propionibacteriaceae bacterium]|jgi:hypothetical protein|nr:hypothetical protein [Propionibacteriaceae bacterium]